MNLAHPPIAPTVLLLAKLAALIDWWPPLWFLGVVEVLWGRPEGVFGSLARVAAVALLAAVLAAAVTYTLAHARGVSRLRETLTTVTANRPRLLTRVLRIVTLVASRDPLSRASFTFTACAMARSARQRLSVAGYLGVGVAISAANLAMVAGQLGRRAFETPQTAVMAVHLAWRWVSC